LASLYNQPAQSAQQPQTNRGQGSSSDAISGISSAFSAITMNSYQAPISNFGQSYNSQQHQGNMGMGHMGGANPNPMSSQMGSQMNSQRGIQMNPQSSSISMTGGQMSNQMGGQIGSQMNAPMSSSNSMGYMNPHANSSSSMGMGSRGPASMQYGRGLGGQGDVSPTNGNSMVGNYHSQQSQPQHQQQQQQLQQQQQQQQHQQQQSHQQPYRGMTTTQNTPKAPIDSFGFISSTITSQIQNSSLQKSQMSGSNPNPALGSMSQNTTQYRG
jgi:hypothetical protein